MGQHLSGGQQQDGPITREEIEAVIAQSPGSNAPAPPDLLDYARNIAERNRYQRRRADSRPYWMPTP